jgi:hypothetical protein
MPFAKTEAPLTVAPGTTGTTTVVETAAGVQVAFTETIQYASSDTSVATYAADGTWAVLSTATNGQTCNMTQLGATSGLSDTTTITVATVAPPPADTLIGTLVPNAGRAPSFRR